MCYGTRDTTVREMTERYETQQPALSPLRRAGGLFAPASHRRLAGAVVALGLLSAVALTLSGCSTAAFSSPVSAGSPPASRVPATTPGQDYAQAESLRLSGNCDRAIPLYLRAISKSALF